MDIGLDETYRKNMCEGLSKFLADSYALYLKTQYFHWNVKGPEFRDLHLMFQKEYEELATAIDEIAEKIAILGFRAPGTFGEFSKLASLKESSKVPSAKDMVMELMQDHEAIVKQARKLAGMAADSNDEATVDLMAERMEVHEKTAWMLRSRLK